MAAIGWYGPLIDLSKAACHIGDYVQLIVFVHRSTPVQYKLAKCGREVIRTDIQVGDDTRSFFHVSIWQKQMGSMVVAGDVVLLQNIKITRFGDFVEARAIHCSSLKYLVHPCESLVSKGLDAIMWECQVAARTKEKLRRVIEWVQQAGSTLHDHTGQRSINWKVQEERCSQDCCSLLEVSCLTDSCKANFRASVGEIFLPLTWKHLPEAEEERMFISRRLCTMGDKYLAEDLICSGCQLCGSPLNPELGSTWDESTKPFYCQKSSNHLHIKNLIYRPFMLYVSDVFNYIPLLVKNKAAELLFGNIKAESVHSCYSDQKHVRTPNPIKDQNVDHSNAKATTHSNIAEGGFSTYLHPSAAESFGQKGKKQSVPDFYSIWLIMLKLLMQQGKNSPLKFKVRVNVGKDWDRGRFEMMSVSMPCFEDITSPV